MPTLAVGMFFRVDPHAHDQRGHDTQLPVRRAGISTAMTGKNALAGSIAEWATDKRETFV